jgi:hypothetical protein
MTLWPQCGQLIDCPPSGKTGLADRKQFSIESFFDGRMLKNGIAIYAFENPTSHTSLPCTMGPNIHNSSERRVRKIQGTLYFSALSTNWTRFSRSL